MTHSISTAALMLPSDVEALTAAVEAFEFQAQEIRRAMNDGRVLSSLRALEIVEGVAATAFRQVLNGEA